MEAPMTETNRKNQTLTTSDKNLGQALQKIYQVYGPNLPAFFSDVQRKLNQERCEDLRGSVQAERNVTTKRR
jgi:hypothetical protein